MEGEVEELFNFHVYSAMNQFPVRREEGNEKRECIIQRTQGETR